MPVCTEKIWKDAPKWRQDYNAQLEAKSVNIALFRRNFQKVVMAQNLHTVTSCNIHRANVRKSSHQRHGSEAKKQT